MTTPMPTLTIQIGQYGNQLAPVFFEHILRYAFEDKDADIAGYFRISEKEGRLQPRAILVDTE